MFRGAWDWIALFIWLASILDPWFFWACSIGFRIDGTGWYELGVGDIDVSVLVGAVLEQVSVEGSLLRSLGVQGVDLLPVLGPRGVLVDEAKDGGLLALLGDELKEDDATQEDSDGDDGSGLQAQVSIRRGNGSRGAAGRRVAESGRARFCGPYVRRRTR